jgi:hypothetical protein
MMGKLLPFMKFLEREAGFGFDIEKFEHRLMLQKYVFATILSVYDTYRKKFGGAELKKRVISTSCDIKSATEGEKIRRVFEELKIAGLIDV